MPPFETMPLETVLNRPMADPPNNIHPNFEHPQNEATLAYTVLAISLATTTLFAWFRLLVKTFIVGSLHLEDCKRKVMYRVYGLTNLPQTSYRSLGYLAAAGHVACGFVINEFAPIIHSWEMTMRTFGRYLLWYKLGSIFYNISIVLIKVSMLVQVLRVFVPRGSRSKTYYVCHTLIWVNVIYYTIAVFTMIFTCRPINKAWQPWVQGTCLEIGAIAMSTAAVNLVGDLCILAVTQIKIWNLIRVKQSQRIKLSVVFCAAIIPCAFAIMCLYYNALSMQGHDFAHSSAYMSIACHGEIASGMFVLFLPMLPRFFTHIKENASVFTHTTRGATQKRAASALEFSDISAANGGSRVEKDVVMAGRGDAGGGSGGNGRKGSLWHISYTERNGSEDLQPILPAGGKRERSIVVKTEVEVHSNRQEK
ncbi:unnamed protein product [Periconia digitata]|uniref:Rhodopsin domain-containing protein n=1 Tax=Periconia digitata TaxID=1303443 RepID=A0A9W4UH45_9PLEO|nr:unnamed protein product [Periconia digitata]